MGGAFASYGGAKRMLFIPVATGWQGSVLPCPNGRHHRLIGNLEYRRGI